MSEYRNVDHLLFDENGEYKQIHPFLAGLCREQGISVQQMYEDLKHLIVPVRDYKAFARKLNNGSLTPLDIYYIAKAFSVDPRDVGNANVITYMNTRRTNSRYMSDFKKR